jgi:hypothetical protein
MQDSRTYTALALAGRSINDLLLPNAEGQHLMLVNMFSIQ